MTPSAADAGAIADAVAQAIADLGVAGAAATPRPVAVRDRTGGAVSTVSLEYAVGDDGYVYGAGDTVPEDDPQRLDVELIQTDFGWIAMAQVRGPRRTECVGWSGAADGDQLDSLLSGDPRNAAAQALAMLQQKGCLAASRPAFPPIPVAAAAAPAPGSRRRAGAAGIAAIGLVGGAAVVLAFALRPDSDDGGDDAALAPTTTTTTTSSTTTTTTTTTATATTLPVCDEFAVTFTWTVRGGAAYPIEAPASAYAGQAAVANLVGAGLPSSATAVVGADGLTVFGPYEAGPGPWGAALVSVGGQAPPAAEPPAVGSQPICD